jgi:hypothetical protein
MRSRFHWSSVIALIGLLLAVVALAQQPAPPGRPVVVGGLTAPHLTSLSVSSGPIGTTVIITGTTFSTLQTSSTVTFSGTIATATAWSNTSITVTVPSGATTGNVIVTTVAGASNGLSFTVTASSSNPIDASRRVDWSGAGVVGGIPSGSWTRCGSVIAAPSSSAAINTALGACTANHYVELAAGTFTLSAGIVFGGISNVELRGQGANQTFLVFSGGNGCHGGYGSFVNVCITASDNNFSGGPSNSANWTAGYTQGTTTITLSSTTNLHANSVLILDQLDDTADNGGFFVCSSNSISPPCSLEGNSGASRANRSQQQIVLVTAVNGNQVTFTPGLYVDNWTGTKSPGAWWATSPITHDGVRDLSLDYSSNTGDKGIFISDCYGCWVYGVRSIDSGKAHVELVQSMHDEVRDSYFYLTQNSISQSYGIEALAASDDLYINNINQYVATPLMVNGSCEGCVLAYNYSINDYYTGSSSHYNLPTTNQHTGGEDMMLWEGNVGGMFSADNFHGTHNFVTSFRNYWQGTQPTCWAAGTTNAFGACTDQLIGLDIHAYSRFYNLIGNVVGASGVHTTYGNGSKPIFELNDGNTEAGKTVPSDPLVTTTLFRWGNYDTVTNAVHWCGNSSNTGWTAHCSSTGGACSGGSCVSEVPSGLSQYANSIPATETLPASLYFAAKPSWWPVAKVWPPIGPDVTGGNVRDINSGTLGGHVYSIPAQDCYTNVMGGPADGTGPVLSFNRATCYP